MRTEACSEKGGQRKVSSKGRQGHSGGVQGRWGDGFITQGWKTKEKKFNIEGGTSEDRLIQQVLEWKKTAHSRLRFL